MRELKFNPGDVIISEGTFGSTAYILKSGTVEVQKQANQKKITLAVLQTREIFGELGLIDDKPRSASIVAKTLVIVDEISREDFITLLDDKAPYIIPILRAFFEHLRQANQMVLQLEARIGDTTKEPVQESIPSEERMEGLTTAAKQVLKNNVAVIKKFPYKIGRESSHRYDDVFVDNDLSLADDLPYNVSRNHMSINFYKDQYYVLDRGSSLGTIVNNIAIGGRLPNFKAELKKGENFVIIGAASSQHQFKIII